jgi:hypothetical protein
MTASGARVITLSIALTLLGATSAGAQTPTAPYDGSNPFNCELQQAGQSDVGPHPDVDPYCVEFDKTEQNITDSGFIEFLALEPTRVAAAGPKCFYYQRDHWTGWVVQDEPPELWHWDGGYFFDKAQGVGGVHVENFRVMGQSENPGDYAPAEYAPYFDEGGGGVQVTDQGEVDPTCAAKVDTPEEREQVYRDDPDYKDCISPGGELQGRRVGKVRLGMAPRRVRNELGAPRSRKRGIDRWCVVGGASLRVAYGRGSPRGAALIRTTSRGHSEQGVAPGDRRARAHRKLNPKPAFHLGKTDVEEAQPRAERRLFLGLRGRRVHWLAVVDPERLESDEAIKRVLRRAR